MTQRMFLAGIVLLTLLAGAIRISGLAEPSLWADEMFTIRNAGRAFEERPNSRSLGYYPTAIALSWFGVDRSRLSISNNFEWRSLGVDESRARIASCLIGIISIPILGIAARGLLGARGALVAALFLSLSPWHIQWSQTARFYTQEFLFYNLAFVFFFAAASRGSSLIAIAAALAMILAVLSHPTAILIAAIFAAFPILDRLEGRECRLGRWGWIGLGGAVAVCAGLVLVEHFQAPEYLGAYAEKERLSPIKVVAKAMFRIDPVVIVLGGLSLLSDLRERRGLYLGLGSVLPLVAVGVLGTRLWADDRYVFACLFAWICAAAHAAERIFERCHDRTPLATAPIALAVVSMVAWGIVGGMSAAGFNPRWRDAFELVAEKRQAGEQVFANPVVGRYYLEEDGVKPVQRRDQMYSDPAQGIDPHWVVTLSKLPWYRERLSYPSGATLEGLWPLGAARSRHAVIVVHIPPLIAPGAGGAVP